MGRERKKEERGTEQEKKQENMEMTSAPNFTGKKNQTVSSDIVIRLTIIQHVPYDSTKPLRRKILISKSVSK